MSGERERWLAVLRFRLQPIGYFVALCFGYGRDGLKVGPKHGVHRDRVLDLITGELCHLSPYHPQLYHIDHVVPQHRQVSILHIEQILRKQRYIF